MRKFTTLAIAMALTVAGCSASTSRASSDDVMTEVTPAPPIVNTEIPSSFRYIFKAIDGIKDKQIRNHSRMMSLVDYLKTRVNKTPYVFASSSIYGWDCSGMVRWMYNQFGLDIPHSADKQAHLGTRVSDPNVGDIVVFAYQGSTDFYHAAIYIGEGEIVHANRAQKTTVIEPLSNYKDSQIRFVRLVDQLAPLY